MAILSRKIVAWQVYEAKSREWASEVMRDIGARGQRRASSSRPRLRDPVRAPCGTGYRVEVYKAAKAKHPERWRGATRNWQPVQIVHLNPDQHVIDNATRKENISALRKAA